jgi:hypothetical protein
LVAGCGSFTKHDYIQRADGICGASLRSVRALTPPTVSGPQAAQNASLGAYLDRMLPLMRRELGHLQALPRPSESATQKRARVAYLGALKQSIDQFATLAAAAHTNQTAEVRSLERALAANPAPRLASKYGLRNCSSSAATYR